MADDRLKAFYVSEVNEIMQNKLRFGAIVVSLVAAVVIYIFNDTEAEVTAAVDNESPKIIAASNDKSNSDKTSDKSSDKPVSKVTSITGLERASEGVELINPFKSDLVKPPIETKSPKPELIPLPQMPKIKEIENSDKVVLTLKGTAISGNKKMAIIQRSVVGKDNSAKSTNYKDKSKNESLLLNIGDEIDGRSIVVIDKDFVIFDDGYNLHIQEALQ